MAELGQAAVQIVAQRLHELVGLLDRRPLLANRLGRLRQGLVLSEPRPHFARRQWIDAQPGPQLAPLGLQLLPSRLRGRLVRMLGVDAPVEILALGR
jgi:hypothetical protein